MSSLRICLFGSRARVIHVLPPGIGGEQKVARCVQRLLAYLLLKRRRLHAREILVEQLWSGHDSEHARACLNTTLWRLRTVLEPPGVARGTYLLTTSDGEIGLNPDGRLWLDVAIFEENARLTALQAVEKASDSQAQNLERALQLYCADLLEGFYDNWLVEEQARLRQLRLDVFEWLFRYYRRQGASERSLLLGQRILEQDPLREDIHRELMELYRDCGQRTLALRQYEICRQTLAAELGIQPMTETQALYTDLRGTSPLADPLCDSVPPPDLQQALERLELARRAFTEAAERLRQAIQVVEQLSRATLQQDIQ
ncbi:MAG TPA: BTAD domain-containing putative transcriptional regulator [Candidatus Competibacteraceae bacterium]|nr:BTAD domain-containing putative transcriptional regulator [Candidatus Competibacteraceae bacterium]